MPMLHDAAVRQDLRRRIDALTPASPRQWGKMTIDQMLWHVNLALEQALGRFNATRSNPVPLPKVVIRWVVLTLPWPKGSPTPDFVATGSHDFEAERARASALIDDFAGQDINRAWPSSPSFGRMTGKSWSRLMAKHLDHHLRQFSA